MSIFTYEKKAEELESWKLSYQKAAARYELSEDGEGEGEEVFRKLLEEEGGFLHPALRGESASLQELSYSLVGLPEEEAQARLKDHEVALELFFEWEANQI